MEEGQRKKICKVEHVVTRCFMCGCLFWKQVSKGHNRAVLNGFKHKDFGACNDCVGLPWSDRAKFPRDVKNTRPESQWLS